MGPWKYLLEKLARVEFIMADCDASNSFRKERARWTKQANLILVPWFRKGLAWIEIAMSMTPGGTLPALTYVNSLLSYPAGPLFSLTHP